MALSRGLAIKAVLFAGFLLFLLNLIASRLDEKAYMNITKIVSAQWPKRTRSNAVIYQNGALLNMSLDNKNLNTTISPIISTTTNLTLINNLVKTINFTKEMINNTNLDIINNTNNNIIILKNKTSNVLQSNTINNISKNEINSNKIKISKDINEDEHSTKSNFIQNLMTTLGLNSCPPVPPNLEGPIEADLKPETLENVEKRFKLKLQSGGWYNPSECNARDHVAIIVPYRDRAQQLPIFLKNLHPFLMKQQINYGIFVVEQTTGSLFNRASLMNIGAVEALKLSKWDCFVFHDVDLLPLDDRNLYTCPDQPRHMSVAVDTFHFKLPYSTIFGGVAAMNVKQFQKVNGFSNSFWGWGGEDDDMSNRLKHVGYHIARYPVNIARYTMLSHKKEKANPKRYETLSTGAKRIEVDGLNSLKYKVKSISKKPLYTWLLVEIHQEPTPAAS